MYNMVSKITEDMTYGNIANKQRSITKMFPTFYDRVRACDQKGGVRLRDAKRGLWTFDVHSGTKDGVWYENLMRFKDMDKLVVQLAKDKRLWNKAKTEVDLAKMASEILRQTHLDINCECPAFLYWAPAYIMTQRNAKVPPPENRKPTVRNPKQYGATCKHYELLLQELPRKFLSTMARYLKEFYGDDIKKAEAASKKELSGFQQAAQVLQKKPPTQRFARGGKAVTTEEPDERPEHGPRDEGSSTEEPKG